MKPNRFLPLLVFLSAILFAGFATHAQDPPRIIGWGQNNNGQTDIPEGLEDAVQVAGGSVHSLALQTDGTVVAWGLNNYGQTTVPAGLNDVVQVAAGTNHSLALKANGTVVAWGRNVEGQIDVPEEFDDVVQIAAGAHHSLALRANGTVVAWGNNTTGQINVPVGLDTAVQIAGGSVHSLALRADGTVVAWGIGAASIVPAGLNSVVQVATGTLHGLALREDGSVIAWGSNSQGQTAVPEGLNNVVQIAAGDTHSLALTADGTVVAWGRNDDGEATVPVDLPDTYQIKGGWNFSLALVRLPDEDSQLLHVQVEAEQTEVPPGGTATFSFSFENGDGVPVNNVPVLVRVFSDEELIHQETTAGISNGGTWDYDLPTDISEGELHVHFRAVHTDYPHTFPKRITLYVNEPLQRIIAWGSNTQGQTDVPAGLEDAVQVAGGFGHSLALLTNGTVVAWGRSAEGQTDVPAELNDVVQVSAGAGHSLALRADGTLVTWGNNDFGQTDVPTGLNDAVQVAAGSTHSLALRADGTVLAWGQNNNGQIDVPAGLNGVVQVAAGDWYSLALRADGSAIAWGTNFAGQLDVPEELTDAVQVAAGAYHSVALRANGTVIAWGESGDGQTDVPAGLNNVVQVVAGELSSLALLADGSVVAWGSGAESNVPKELPDTYQMAGGSRFYLALVRLPDEASQMLHMQVEAQEMEIPADGTATFSFDFDDGDGVPVNNVPVLVRLFNDGELIHEETTAGIANGGTWDFNVPAGISGDLHARFQAVHEAYPHSYARMATVYVQEVNNPPAFTSTPVTEAHENEVYLYEITASDPDGDDLTITATVLPEWLTLTDHGDGTATLTGTPLAPRAESNALGDGMNSRTGTTLAANAGPNPVTLVVSDGELNAEQEFSIQVIAIEVNNPPVFDSEPITEAHENEVYLYQITASDPDDDDLTITASVLPEWLTLTDNGNGTATLTGMPLEAHVGANAVTLLASDGDLETPQVFNVQVIAIEINNPPTPAVITSPEDGEEIIVTDNPTTTVLVEWTVSEDPDGDEVTYVWQADFNEDFSAPAFAIATSETILEIPMQDLVQALTDHGIIPGQSAPLYHRILSSDDEDTTTGPAVTMVLTYTVSNEDGSPGDVFMVRGLYPNPSSGPMTLGYDLPESAEVRMDIYDLLGRVVTQIDAGMVAAGAGRTITIPVDMLGAGTYLYRLVANGTGQPETSTGRFTIVR